ncbi:MULTISPECIES: MoxR family ATPase [unclassified Wenzhouxiangella]|uniref:AAA family ATPase n=1 Tax=unclassified Wenzhouxiangella TaxID=2613841 RepID=UPI000E325A84|nr:MULTISPECIES: MoxR family ATPase [unclassified Wenzhouxiangella]RFF26351.1 MoxR family ATPase [Wenzhouxiangella sp. 15181]RFP67377.1 MoxR family ATPase [Wenzhouxiangella sp. 15190]
MNNQSPARSGSLLADDLARARSTVNDIIVDKEAVVDLAFSALLAGGHLLIEDLPGVGKTTLAHALSIAVGGNWQRIQFTSDMLPADILGVSIFRREDEQFEFRPGPIFANVVLADEINRATPRTQSALLEAMAEGQATVDGHTHRLPQPFYVIATQNPLDLTGTYPLPDSQLDRFLLRTRIGYPSAAEERRLLTEPDRRDLLRDMESVLDPARVLELIELAAGLHVSEPILDYIQALVAATRTHPAVKSGLSPRAALALTQTSRAHALIMQQDFCLPDNVRTVFPALAGHRLQPTAESHMDGDAVAAEILESTPVP